MKRYNEVMSTINRIRMCEPKVFIMGSYYLYLYYANSSFCILPYLEQEEFRIFGVPAEISDNKYQFDFEI